MTTELSLQELNSRLDALEVEIESLKLRNKRVEADKAWETSLPRILTIAIVTYIAAVVVFQLIGSSRCFLDAFIPSGAYLLSVQTLPFIKRAWLSSCDSK